MTQLDTALLLIASTRAALHNNVRHRDKSGRLLHTEREIIEALQRDGSFEFDERERVENVTTEQMLEEVRREYQSRFV